MSVYELKYKHVHLQVNSNILMCIYICTCIYFIEMFVCVHICIYVYVIYSTNSRFGAIFASKYKYS